MKHWNLALLKLFIIEPKTKNLGIILAKYVHCLHAENCKTLMRKPWKT